MRKVELLFRRKMDSSLLAANRESAESFFELAKARLEDGDEERAVKLLQKAIRMNSAETKYEELLNKIDPSYEGEADAESHQVKEKSTDAAWTVKGGCLAPEQSVEERNNVEDVHVRKNVERGFESAETASGSLPDASSVEKSEVEGGKTTKREKNVSERVAGPAVRRVGGARTSRLAARRRRDVETLESGKTKRNTSSAATASDGKAPSESELTKKKKKKSETNGSEKATGQEEERVGGLSPWVEWGKDRAVKAVVYSLVFVWVVLVFLWKGICAIVLRVKEWTLYYVPIVWAYLRIKAVKLWRERLEPKLGPFLLKGHCIWTKFKVFLLTKLGRKDTKTQRPSFFNEYGNGQQSNAEEQQTSQTIELPTTSDGAVERLLTCRNEDLYSILGVARHATEDEIKRHYRKQAIMVHPDKNKSPGTEEAFKILSQAFETLGDPEKKRAYDTQAAQSEFFKKKFEPVFEEIMRKMEEAKNFLQCSNCCGTHRRYIRKDLPLYSARYCSTCSVRHPVNEGDMWCETAWIGLKVYFYACMDRAVWDISEWAGCQGLQHRVKPNAHDVIMRIGMSKPHNRQQFSNPGLNREEDFFSSLFKSGQFHQREHEFPSNQHRRSTSDGHTGTNNLQKHRSGKKKKRKA
eukprot:m.15150 g.15150  ORF g.15150 m.15150 type:complete len:637 (+) comp26212_c0_seq1:334-2244(+)